MRSIKEIFISGYGPSSSHTMGPAFSCDYILKKYHDIKYIKVILYGSLARTGKGHLTDYIIDLKLKNYDHEIIFDTDKKDLVHPNTMEFIVTTNDNKIYKETIISIGGGTILTKDEHIKNEERYKEKSLEEILNITKKENISLSQYVINHEDKDILDYLSNIYDVMEDSRNKGIKEDGYLPGKLHVKRKAKEMYLSNINNKDRNDYILKEVVIASFAVSEENASGNKIVTAPTCGSAGVIPGAIRYLYLNGYSKEDIIQGLLVAGLIGLIAKTNASISGAECGCQAEIGVASAMAAALISTTKKYSNEKIAQACEIALEHSLGLTCDPVEGYVQIPCIERCAMFALKAIDATLLADIIPEREAKVSYDKALQAMYQTGKDLNEGYRETSLSGLAKLLK